MNTGIDYNMHYEEFDSFIAAGATMDELVKLSNDGYDTKFKATVIAWNRGRKMIRNNSDDAVAKKRNKK